MAKAVARIPSVSLSVGMPKEALEFIDKQVAKGYFSSREEFINSAGTLLKWAIDVAEKGEEVASYHDATSEVTPIEFNSKIKPIAPRSSVH